jgi:hypothetical protein
MVLYLCAALTNALLFAGIMGIKEALNAETWNIPNAAATQRWFTPSSTKQKTERLFFPFSLS